MKTNTIENLIDKIILDKLKEKVLIDTDDILEDLATDYNDKQELRDFIYNSKRYNSVYTDINYQYVFGTKKQCIKNAVEKLCGLVQDDDACWVTYIDCDGKSMKLNEFINLDEV